MSGLFIVRVGQRTRADRRLDWPLPVYRLTLPLYFTSALLLSLTMVFFAMDKGGMSGDIPKIGNDAIVNYRGALSLKQWLAINSVTNF